MTQHRHTSIVDNTLFIYFLEIKNVRLRSDVHLLIVHWVVHWIERQSCIINYALCHTTRISKISLTLKYVFELNENMQCVKLETWWFWSSNVILITLHLKLINWLERFQYGWMAKFFVLMFDRIFVPSLWRQWMNPRSFNSRK